ncbi:tryptophan--tRNA ligase [Candidatus Woesearchaeota archaeon]|mgnify:FL=1|jgi:tryptophanyl-tRNA synthetase|nr:tryptophan--tRNA ligase [Candidatus Woesearchaeota archaeon]MBT7237342.1 tryptophan--tRNA ligase [Candidatus Woesearchaeota archaeon]
MAKLTPYEVEGEVDYNKVIKQFGASLIDNKLKSKLNGIRLVDKNVFFAHRDLDKIIGKDFAIVSGRGPSAKITLAHLQLFKFVKEMQDKFGCRVFIPLSDDEKFLFKSKLSFEESKKLAYENLLDILAVGFDPKKTEVIIDFENMDQELYNLSMKCGKTITNNTVRSAFGFTGDKNIGINFYPAMQIAHILYPTVKYGIPSLVAVGVDQDVFIKLARDVAYKLKLTKPGDILSKFLPGLDGGSKMSSSNPYSAIYTDDSMKDIEKKLKKAFSGGRETLEEHRKKGGNPDIDVCYQYLNLFLEDDEEKLKEIYDDYKSGKLLTGDLKKYTIKKTQECLKEHQENREKVKKSISKFLV